MTTYGAQESTQPSPASSQCDYVPAAGTSLPTPPAPTPAPPVAGVCGGTIPLPAPTAGLLIYGYVTNSPKAWWRQASRLRPPAVLWVSAGPR